MVKRTSKDVGCGDVQLLTSERVGHDLPAPLIFLGCCSLQGLKGGQTLTARLPKKGYDMGYAANQQPYQENCFTVYYLGT